MKLYRELYLVRGSVEPEVYARQRVNRLHRFKREPMPESADQSDPKGRYHISDPIDRYDARVP
jgi:hypothetical protein